MYYHVMIVLHGVLHRFNELATKSEKRNGKPRLACVNVRYPPSKNHVGGHAGVKENDRVDRLAGKSNHHKRVASRKI